MRGSFARMSSAVTAIALSVLIVANARAATTTGGATSPVIMTEDGPVRGVYKEGVREFLGIPYAAPPIGQLRWRPAAPHAPWKATLDATRTGSFCSQFPRGARNVPTSEDCLFLNIYTPASPANRLPVMFWIHGGTFIIGSGAWHDGSALARKHKLVVVTINYRLGPLGFFTSPSLDAESVDQVSGNYGLLNQQAALKWVKRNIAAFGGDPNKITVAGESAGAISTCLQMFSPSVSGLFRGAIMESGICLYPFSPTMLAEAEKRDRELTTKVGCDRAPDVAACLRSKSARQLLSVIPASWAGPIVWAPVVDGHAIPKRPAEALRAGNFNRVPIIIGSNRNEGTLFIAARGPLPAEKYAAEVGSIMPLAAVSSRSDTAAKVLAAYPVSAYPSPSQGLAAIRGDRVSCAIERMSELLSAFVPTYEYEFNDPNAPSTVIPHPPFPLGAHHTADIQYVFQTYFPVGLRSGAPDFSPAQQKLSERIASYWSAFIAAGNPDETSPVWSAEKPGDVKILSLSPDKIHYESDFAMAHQCLLWNSLWRD